MPALEIPTQPPQPPPEAEPDEPPAGPQDPDPPEEPIEPLEPIRQPPSGPQDPDSPEEPIEPLEPIRREPDQRERASARSSPVSSLRLLSHGEPRACDRLGRDQSIGPGRRRRSRAAPAAARCSDASSASRRACSMSPKPRYCRAARSCVSAARTWLCSSFVSIDRATVASIAPLSTLGRTSQSFPSGDETNAHSHRPTADGSV